jgi:6-pyruvoyl-tetrahydropterin synthase
MSVTTRYAASVQFGASHELPGHHLCGRLHGHSYHVTLTWDGVPIKENWGFPMTQKAFNESIAIVLELRNRHLNDMLPAGHPSVSGIAAYLLERLRILGVVMVEVHESDTDVKGTVVHVAG